MLTFEPDVSQGNWLMTGGDPWHQVCSIGPSGFPRYARLFHPVDPRQGKRADQLANVEGDLDPHTLQTLTTLLAEHTTTAEDCFFALWDGFGEVAGSPSAAVIQVHLFEDGTSSSSHGPVVPPAFPPEVTRGPRLRIPARDHLLFRGPIEEAGWWGAAELPFGGPRPINSPNLMWPADRAWLVATEIDLPWTGIAGCDALVDAVLAHEELDAEPVPDPTQDLPYGRTDEDDPWRS